MGTENMSFQLMNLLVLQKKKRPRKMFVVQNLSSLVFQRLKGVPLHHAVCTTRRENIRGKHTSHFSYTKPDEQIGAIESGQ